MFVDLEVFAEWIEPPLLLAIGNDWHNSSDCGKFDVSLVQNNQSGATVNEKAATFSPPSPLTRNTIIP